MGLAPCWLSLVIIVACEKDKVWDEEVKEESG